MNVIKRVAMSITMTAILTIVLAPISSADPTTHLKSEVDAARTGSGCPAYQSDPVLNAVTQRIMSEANAYANHTATFLPVSDDVSLMRVLRESGYYTVKAKLLNGYGDINAGGPGDNEAKAIKAVVLEGTAYQTFTDCGYTKYGFGAINNDSSQGFPSSEPRSYSVAEVLVAG